MRNNATFRVEDPPRRDAEGKAAQPRPVAISTYGTGIEIRANYHKIKEKAFLIYGKRGYQSILFRTYSLRVPQEVNRHTILLEPAVSHRKQRTGIILIATKTLVSVQVLETRKAPTRAKSQLMIAP